MTAESHNDLRQVDGPGVVHGLLGAVAQTISMSVRCRSRVMSDPFLPLVLCKALPSSTVLWVPVFPSESLWLAYMGNIHLFEVSGPL